MKISRVWAMPNKNTFDIYPISALISRYYRDSLMSVDPFANKQRLATITNDIDPQYNCNYNLDAVEFLSIFEDNSVDLVFNDPPFSPRQVSECYKSLGLTVNMETTQSSFWSRQKDEISRILKVGGHCISFGWNSNGIGKGRGFEIVEILLVAHGGSHNDTICVVEKKSSHQLELF